MGFWPQGDLKRPEGMPVPKNLNYDVWLGPAPNKPYNPETLHFNWRGLWDYGTGAMGDMGAHIFDAPIWALNLGMPTKYKRQVLHTALIICLFVNWLHMNSLHVEICRR